MGIGAGIWRIAVKGESRGSESCRSWRMAYKWQSFRGESRGESYRGSLCALIIYRGECPGKRVLVPPAYTRAWI